MKKVADFAACAEKCERLAKLTADPTNRKQMNEIASQWRELAEQRELLLHWSVYRMATSKPRYLTPTAGQ